MTPRAGGAGPSPIPPGLDAQLDDLVALGMTLAGHMTAKEVRFIAMVAALPTCAGDILEIGSYQGKSTIILARAAGLAGVGRVAAVDPLSVPASTDPRDVVPEELPAIFYGNLREHGVQDRVDFHQMTSAELGPSWTRPLRFLWIDGDHTWDGARTDFDVFNGFLQPGAIVAFHDVLHRFEGPIRAMAERVLVSPMFGACGVSGSIGWGQYLGDAQLAAPFQAAKARLRDQLLALLPLSRAESPYSPLNELLFKYHRARVPHGAVRAAAWAREVRFFR